VRRILSAAKHRLSSLNGRLRSTLIGAIVLGSGAALLYSRLPSSETKFLTAKVAPTTLESNIVATGFVQPIRQVDVGTRVTGQLQSLKAHLGDHVRAGDLLAEIDPSLSENNLRAAKAHLVGLEAQKRAQLAKAKRSRLEFERQKGLIGGSNATSRRDLEKADAQLQEDEAGIAALDAQIAQARAQVDIATTNLNYSRITAPMDGEVVAILTQEGQTVVASQIVPVILKLANLDAMTIRTQVSEADVTRVRVGQPVSFAPLGEGDKRYESRLRLIEPAPQNYSDAAHSASNQSGQSSGSGTRTTAVYYDAIFDVPNKDHLLRIGMTAQVSIRIAEPRTALAIPSAALGDKLADGRYTVRVLTAEGKVETKEVRVGLDNFIQTEILNGLSEGEEVIVTEPDAIGEGK
jgi:membrane fusion protein, macrolide-specific efflux system